jgi:hypothetical protein
LVEKKAATNVAVGGASYADMASIFVDSAFAKQPKKSASKSIPDHLPFIIRQQSSKVFLG